MNICVYLFPSERGEFIFIQLPDTLPGDPSGRGDDPRARSKQQQQQQQETSNENETDNPSDVETELAKRLGLCNMSEFTEGYIGKIKVRKSGRTQLHLGDNVLDLNLGATPGFLQVSIDTRLTLRLLCACYLSQYRVQFVAVSGQFIAVSGAIYRIIGCDLSHYRV